MNYSMASTMHFIASWHSMWQVVLSVVLYLTYYIYYFINYATTKAVIAMICLSLMWVGIGLYVFIHLSTKIPPETGCNNDDT